MWCILIGQRCPKGFQKKKIGDKTPDLETPHLPKNQGEEVVDFGLYKTYFLNGKSYGRVCWHDMKQLNGHCYKV